MKGNTKKMLIILAIVIIVFIIFMIMRGDGSSGDNALLESSTGANPSVGTRGQTANAADIIGAEIIQALNQINSLQLDASIFSSPAYTTLEDYEQPIPKEDVGRNNPFAPLGAGGGSRIGNDIIIIDGEGGADNDSDSDSDDPDLPTLSNFN